MTVTISAPSGGNRTLTWAITRPSQVILDIGEDAVHHLWNVGYGRHGTPEVPVVWEQLTNIEKLEIMNRYLIDVVKNAAITYNTVNSVGGVDAVRATKLSESNTKYDLG